MSEKSTAKVEDSQDKAQDKAQEKEAEQLKAVEAHVSPDDTEMPDHSAQRKVEAHRQAQVGASVAVETGDDSAVNPQPDRDAPGEPLNFAPIVEGERQVTEQPDRYAVSGDSEGSALEPNAKNRRGRRGKKKDDGTDADSADSGVEEPAWPAQYEGDPKDDRPAQYSY